MKKSQIIACTLLLNCFSFAAQNNVADSIKSFNRKNISEKSNNPQKAKLSLREIDRPLVLPKGIWQAGAGCGMDFILSRQSNEPWQIINPGLLTGLFPRYSISNRVEVPGIPLPYIKILMTEKDIANNDSGSGTSMTFEGGISGAAYSGRGSFIANMASGITIKQVLSDKLWFQGSVFAKNSGNTEPGNQWLSARGTGLIGIQATDRIALASKISIEASHATSYNWVYWAFIYNGTFSETVIFHFCPGFSMKMEAAFSADLHRSESEWEKYFILPVNFGIIWQWGHYM